MKAIIPIKTNSQRVPNKNLRPFYKEDSLFDVKAKQLLKVLPPEDIYVSSECPSVASHADRYGLQFILRGQHLTDNNVPMSEVVTSVVNQIEGDDDVMWTQVTEPLFGDFKKCLNVWSSVRGEHDSLVVVKPFKQYLIDEHGRGINYCFGHWHKPSQALPKWYSIPYSLHIMTRECVRKCNYYVGIKPYLYESQHLSVDIDDLSDFELASFIFEKLQ